MSTKKSKGRQQLSGAALKQFRHEGASLKALGLISKRKDFRTQAPTRYMTARVRELSDALKTGSVVTVPKRAKAKEYSEDFITVGRKVIIPTVKGEKLTYRKKSDEIVGHATVAGRRVERVHLKKRVRRVEDLPTGSDIIYAIPIGNSIQRFDTIEDLRTFMIPGGSVRPYKDWEKYVIVEHIDDVSDDDEL